MCLCHRFISNYIDLLEQEFCHAADAADNSNRDLTDEDIRDAVGVVMTDLLQKYPEVRANDGNIETILAFLLGNGTMLLLDKVTGNTRL